MRVDRSDAREARRARAAGAPAPAAQPRADAAHRWRVARTCRRSPASTRPSTTASRRSRSASRCRRRCAGAGVRRYGFHGLSYEYIAGRLRELDARARRRAAMIVAHLGNGASLCAMQRRPQRRDTTMGFTAARRAADGHALRQPRSRRRAVSDATRWAWTRARSRSCSTSSRGCSAFRAISSDMRDAARQRRAAGARMRDRPVRLPHRSRTRLAGGGAGRPRRAGLHRPASARTTRPSAPSVLRGAAWAGFAVDEAADASGGPRMTRG